MTGTNEEGSSVEADDRFAGDHERRERAWPPAARWSAIQETIRWAEGQCVRPPVAEDLDGLRLPRLSVELDHEPLFSPKTPARDGIGERCIVWPHARRRVESASPFGPSILAVDGAAEPASGSVQIAYRTRSGSRGVHNATGQTSFTGPRPLAGASLADYDARTLRGTTKLPALHGHWS